MYACAGRELRSTLHTAVDLPGLVSLTTKTLAAVISSINALAVVVRIQRDSALSMLTPIEYELASTPIQPVA